MTLRIEVQGLPQPQGSARAVPIGNGRMRVTSANVKLRPWRQAVIAAAREEWGEREPVGSAVDVTCVFRLPRPVSHFGARGLRPSAPSRPKVRPDLDKLVRAVLDALTEAGVWRDDGQVVGLQVVKLYGVPGAAITVSIASEIAGIAGRIAERGLA